MGGHRKKFMTQGAGVRASGDGSIEPGQQSYGVVLSGGGAYAAYEVGILRALFSGLSPATGRDPLHLNVVTGTSAGAFNASLLLSQSHADFLQRTRYMESVWVEGVAGANCGNNVMRYRGSSVARLASPACWMEPPFGPIADLFRDSAFFAQDWVRRGINLFQSAGDLEQRVIELVDVSSLISTHPFATLVEKVVQLENVRASNIALQIAATNWRTGSLRTFANQHMSDQSGHKAVLASSSIPGIFAAVEIEGEPYVDGGVVMNTPLKPAIEAGATVLHVVYLDPDVRAIPLPRLRNTLSDLYRSLVIQFAANIKRDIEIARRLNRGIELLEAKTDASASKDDASALAMAVEQQSRSPLPLKRLTIHRYHPKEASGGMFRWLSFDREHLASLIEVGWQDGIHHDCVASHCIVPSLPGMQAEAATASGGRR
jgi:predicted acylesterase/phospholipase RssA